MPGIKGFIRSFENRRRNPDGASALLLDVEPRREQDDDSYPVWLAAYLHLELLAFIEVASGGKSAEITVAGRCGVTSNLTMPLMGEGGTLSKLIIKGTAQGGRAKIFATGEVFPSDGNWCDVIPMDSAVSFFFMPTAALPRPMSSPELSHAIQGNVTFVLAADTTKHEADHVLELKACLAASLLSHAEAPPDAARDQEILKLLSQFLGDEGYSLCIADSKGNLTHRTREDLRVASPESLSDIQRKILALEGSLETAGAPLELTSCEPDGLRAIAYPLTTSEAGPSYLLILKGHGGAQEGDFRKEWLKLLGRFTSSIAHEIKNPLTGIAAGVQYLAKRLQPGITEADTVDFILAEIARLNRIVDDLYKIARPPQLVLRKTSINEVITKSLFCVSEDIVRKRLRVEQKLQQDIPAFDADPERLQQVLINIIKNAIEASPENGKIDISTHLADGHISVNIKDSGPGVSDRDKTRIFEPFYSTKKGGTGLGLCISQAIVEEHGGKIRVESPLEGGASFTVGLPAGK